MNGLNGLYWGWIALMATAPLLAALLVAFPIWRTRQTILGNLAGTFVVCAAAIALIVRESVELDRLARICLDAGYVCAPNPTAFARYAIYASIALAEIFAVFTISLKVEEKIRSRDYAPEWRG